MIYLLNSVLDSRLFRAVIALAVIIVLFAGMAMLMGHNYADAEETKKSATVVTAQPQQTLPQQTLLVFGDSLVAGYQLLREEAFPARLEKKLVAGGHNVKVVNAGVSGDTTSGGLTRLAWTLDQQKVDYAILELGANDMLRQVDPSVTRENLQKMLDIFKARHIPVLIAGMRSFSNYGAMFGGSFDALYKDLAHQYGTLYYPFFLDGVAMKADLNLDDGMHPNPRGVDIIVDNIYDDVQELLKQKPE